MKYKFIRKSQILTMKICYFAGDMRQMNKTNSEEKYCASWLHIEIPPSAKLYE